jgi:hypothetical protein|tara:strand:- start:5074 stop:5274 length:201 start_codon:yes stop_codon:yes gene_type:complete
MALKTISFKGGIIDLVKLDNGKENIIIDITEGDNPKYDQIVLEGFLIQDWRKDKINGQILTKDNNK